MTIAQEKALNTGYGRCPAEAQTLIKAPMSVRMLGEMEGFFATVAAAVHKHNRETCRDDFVGMVYPEYAERQAGLMRLGNSVMLVGSQVALEALLDTDRLKRFRFGGTRPDVVPHERPRDSKAASFTRSRHNERALPGDIARRIRRFERKGKDTSNLRVELSLALGEIEEDDLPEGFHVRSFRKESFFSLGSKRLAFTCDPRSNVHSDEIRVSTYGFSDPEAPLRVPMMSKPDYDHSLFA